MLALIPGDTEAKAGEIFSLPVMCKSEGSSLLLRQGPRSPCFSRAGEGTMGRQPLPSACAWAALSPRA